MGNKIAIGIGLLVVLVFGRIGLALADRPDDITQIRTALAESVRASREGKAGGVLSKLSDQIKFNGESERGNFGNVADFIRKQRPDVTFSHVDPVITGDHATVTSPADLTLTVLTQTHSIHLKQVVLVFQREDARRRGIVPSREWRLIEVQSPTFGPDDIDL